MSTLNRAFIKALRNPTAAPTLVPAPHINTAAVSSPARAAGPIAAAHTAVGPISVGQASGIGTLPAPPPRSVTARTPLRPVFEVQRMTWPPIAISLLREAADQWGAVVADLSLAAKRSENLVLITSHGRGEGRSTLMCCLIRLLAAGGLSSALVDADFGHGQLARQLRLLPQAGWAGVLTGELPLAEALIESVEDHVTLLPLQGPLADRQLPRNNPRMGASLQRLRGAYDVVLVDGGPAEVTSPADFESLLTAAQFDAAIIVRDVRGTSAEATSDLSRRLSAAGISKLDVAENFVAGNLS